MKQILMKFSSGLTTLALVMSMVGSFAFPVTASAATTGAVFAGTGATSGGNGSSWSNPTRVSANDNSNTTSSISGNGTTYSETLHATNFGFSIPSDATINGIQVSIGRFASKSSSLQDRSVQLIKSGNATGDNLGATSTNWPTSEAVADYGSTSNLWGTTWTPTQINASNFGVALSVDNNNSNSRTASVDYITVTVTYTEAVPPVTPATNPALSSSCGLDIVLVADVSGSIDSTEYSQMQSALGAFATALDGTPTNFAVVAFDGTAITVSPANIFTANGSDVIDALSPRPDPSGSGTNWEAGLNTAGGLFPGSSKPNLIVFASDGDPTESSGPLSDLDDAVTVANSIKTNGTRIITLGIGSGVNTDNLKAISSADAYYSSDFSTLAATLAALADDLCGGTVTVQKLVDGSPASGWSFDVNGSPSNPSPVVTLSDGYTPSVSVDAGTYSVTEEIQAGYSVVSASCTGADNNGSFNAETKSVEGMSIGTNNVVSCVFNNQTNQPPVITLSGDNPITLVVNVDTYVEPGYSATDPEEGDLASFVLVTGTIDTATIGTYHLTYNVTDSHGATAVPVTRTVNVVYGSNQCNDGVDNDKNTLGDGLIDYPQDPGCEGVDDTTENEPPIIAVVNPTITLTVGASNPTLTADVIAHDAEDGDITGSIAVGGQSVDTYTIGDYTVTYDVVDSDTAGAAQKTRTYQIRAQCGDGIDNDGDGHIDYDADAGCESTSDNNENSAPIITLTGDSTINVLVGDVYSEQGAIVNDEEDGSHPAVIGGDVVNTGTPGTYTVTYNYTDVGGIQADEVTRLVQVTARPQCSDDVDNDEDDFTDAQDPQCHTDGNAQNSESYDESINNESGPITQCNDGIDNDSNDDVDAHDPQCHTDGNADNSASYSSSIDHESEQVVVDVCANIEGNQSEIPSGKVQSGEDCVDAPATPPTPPSGGGNGPVNFGAVNGGGLVLGASIGPVSNGQVLGESCGLYMEKHVRFGSTKNNIEQVKKLQTFLNKNMGSSLPITGFYGSLTFAQVKAFQTKYSDEVLKPWGLTAPTGLVYLSTLRQINNLECPDVSAQLPSLVPWSQNPNAQ